MTITPPQCDETWLDLHPVVTRLGVWIALGILLSFSLLAIATCRCTESLRCLPGLGARLAARALALYRSS
jgi:hypothetical protein